LLNETTGAFDAHGLHISSQTRNPLRHVAPNVTTLLQLYLRGLIQKFANKFSCWLIIVLLVLNML